MLFLRKVVDLVPLAFELNYYLDEYFKDREKEHEPRIHIIKGMRKTHMCTQRENENTAT